MTSEKGPQSPESPSYRETPPCPERFIASTAELDPRKRREHELIIVPGSAKLIGRGTRAVVYSALARVVGILPRDPTHPLAGTPFGERKRAHEFPIVLKVYYSPKGADNAFGLYDVCQDAGLHVPRTFRGALDIGTLVMTDLRVRAQKSQDENEQNAETKERKQMPSDSVYVISSNMLNWSIGSEALQKKNLEGIANWESVHNMLFTEPLEKNKDGRVVRGSEVLRATTAQIELQTDVYFFCLPAGESRPEIDPWAVDFDIIQHNPVENRDYARLLRYNVNAIGATCKLFIENFVREKNQKEYLYALYAACTKLLKDGI